MSIRFFAMLFCWCIGAGTALASKPSGIIHLHIDGLRSNRGLVIVSRFAGEEGFPVNPKNAQEFVTCNITDQVADHHFASLPYGYYALASFHDENGNGHFDTGFFGIPLEGVGASNGAKGFMGPPQWKDAKIFLDQAEVTWNISMQYVF